MTAATLHNIFNPSYPGTVISGRACSLSEGSQMWDSEVSSAKSEVRKAACTVRLMENESPIRGITSIDNVAIVSVEGTGVLDAAEVSYRLFGALVSAGVQVIMVSQASAESSICVVVEESSAALAERCLRGAFENELRRGTVSSITVEEGHSVVAIVGEGMAFRPGVGATFTKAMANSRVNIRSIAQGSSERQISLVVEKEDCTRALRAAHAALALSNSQLSVAFVGCTGQVGKALAQQLINSGRVRGTEVPGQVQKVLKDLRLDFKVTALCREKEMVLGYDGLDLQADYWDEPQDSSRFTSQPADLVELTRFLNDDFNGNRVIIDCSASQEVADMYPRWLALGIHVITANKKAGSGPSELYNDCRQAQEGASAQWYYETTGPGSGLPVLCTLKDMVQSGDTVHKVEGIFSGTISYLTNAVAAGLPLSEALLQAHALGLCEPDPRDDLTGLDVRRKIVVLARELGLSLELADVITEQLMPVELSDWEPDTSDNAQPLIEQLSAALAAYDERLTACVTEAADNGMKLVPLGSVDLSTGIASVTMTPLPISSRLTRAEANDNIIAISSERYSPQPLIIQGPGAGCEITASGLFGDMLALSRTLVEWTIPKIE